MTTAPAALVACAVRFKEHVRLMGCSGTTVTVKLHSAVWPQASLAVQVTVVVPIGNVLPLGGVQTTVTGGQPVAELL